MLIQVRAPDQGDLRIFKLVDSLLIYGTLTSSRTSLKKNLSAIKKLKSLNHWCEASQMLDYKSASYFCSIDFREFSTCPHLV